MNTRRAEDGGDGRADDQDGKGDQQTDEQSAPRDRVVDAECSSPASSPQASLGGLGVTGAGHVTILRPSVLARTSGGGVGVVGPPGIAGG